MLCGTCQKFKGNLSIFIEFLSTYYKFLSKYIVTYIILYGSTFPFYCILLLLNYILKFLHFIGCINVSM